MNPLNSVETTVTVAGQQVPFVNLSLNQGFNCHHRCEILVDFEEFDKKWMDDPVKIIKYIGEPVIIEMKHKQTGESNVFNGLVSNIAMVGSHGVQNHILVQGVSPTIKLDGNETMDSFVDKTLSDIATEAVSTSGNGASVTIKPEYSQPIDYVCQYNESAFDFLNRLSYVYGETFYYDGNNINFGALEEGDTSTITYDVEMTSIHLGANLIPSKFKHYSYLVHDDDEKEKETQSSIPTATGYLKASVDRSDATYTANAVSPLAPLVSDSDSILKMVNAERTRDVAGMLTLSGTTQTCKVKIGKCIDIAYPSDMDISTTPGSFIVTQVTHVIDQSGRYENSFTGVRSSLKQVPIAAIPMPTASAQQATVMSNADPDGLGRIQVQFQWQKSTGKNTNWIRVQTPDAGKSDDVPNNRGQVFIPEEGDTVMIGFEYGDPNRPYSMGSIYSEMISKGGADQNFIKTIITRSGHTIKFDDTKGKEKIQIYDIKGNIVEIDTEKDTINVTANSTINMNAIDINMMASNAITMNAGVAIDGKAGALASFVSGLKGVFSAGKDVSVAAGKTLSASGGKNTTVSSGAASQMTLNAKGNAALKGNKQVQVASNKRVEVTGKKETTLKGDKMNMEGKSRTVIKGNKVKVS